MIGLLILLCCVILLSGCVKLSLMPLKISLAWGLAWGIAGYLATIMFSGLSRSEVSALTNIRELSTLEFIELMIMITYLFTSGTKKNLLGLYPGLMVIVPVMAVSVLFSGMFPGMDFKLTGIIAGGVIAVVIIGGTILLRYVGTDNISLYLVTVLAAMFNVVIYGVA